MRSRRMARVTCSIGALVMFAGCTRGDVAMQADSGSADSTVASSAGDERALRHGYLIVTPERLTFLACGDTAVARIIDSSGVLTMAVVPFRAGPVDSLFFVLRADPITAPVQALDEPARQLVVREVVRLSPESRGCAGLPDDYVFHAFGEEPFWALTIRSDGMSFQEPDRQEPLRFPSVVAERSGDVVRYQTASLTPDSIVLMVELRREQCTDSMSGEVTNHVALVRLGSRELHGCAREGTG